MLQAVGWQTGRLHVSKKDWSFAFWSTFQSKLSNLHVCVRAIWQWYFNECIYRPDKGREFRSSSNIRISIFVKWICLYLACSYLPCNPFYIHSNTSQSRGDIASYLYNGHMFSYIRRHKIHQRTLLKKSTIITANMRILFKNPGS